VFDHIVGDDVALWPTSAPRLSERELASPHLFAAPLSSLLAVHCWPRDRIQQS